MSEEMHTNSASANKPQAEVDKSCDFNVVIIAYRHRFKAFASNSDDNELYNALNDFNALTVKIEKEVRVMNWLRYSETCLAAAEAAARCVPSRPEFLRSLVLKSIKTLATKPLGAAEDKTVFSLLHRNCQLILSVFPNKDSSENKLFSIMSTICKKDKIDLNEPNPIDFLTETMESAKLENPKNIYLLEHLSAFTQFLIRFGKNLPNSDWRGYLTNKNVCDSLVELNKKLLETFSIGKAAVSTASSLASTYGSPFAPDGVETAAKQIKKMKITEL